MRKVKWFWTLACLALAVCLVGPAAVNAESIPDVTDYSYTVTPILSPFTYYLYVETENPDPTSFRLVDQSSEFYTSGDKSEIMIDASEYYYSVEVDPGTYYIDQNLYPDVVYVDKSTWRVPGGYIFTSHGAFSDGGEFVLMQKTGSGDSILHDTFEAADVTVPCPPLQTRVSYLIGECTTEEMTFFEKLDAVQAKLDQISVYPRSVYNRDDPNEDHPYPLLAVSPYPELELNTHFDMYNTLSGGILVSNAYPFILDSLGFPGTITSVAQALEPGCEAVSGTYHFMVDVTFEGETHSYGGAGTGGNDPLYSNRVSKNFSFSGSDLASGGTIEDYYTVLCSYESIAAQDAAQYKDLVAGQTFLETIQATGGTWLRVDAEGWGYGTSISYAVPLGSDVMILSDAWVDGRSRSAALGREIGRSPQCEHRTARCDLY